jgi:exosortase A-associated hydrolase 1
MKQVETPLVFECSGCRLVGIAAVPQAPSATGVLILVGGPQYRAGSHRQFTLLARDLAKDGIPSLRFDYRGMGDSEGAVRAFDAVDGDVRAAIDALVSAAPSVRQVVIWGLCDAACAALFYAHTDPRVKGLVLLNPWVHSQSTAGRTRIKHYYFARLLQRSFWAKLFSGQVGIAKSVAELLASVRYFFADKAAPPPSGEDSSCAAQNASHPHYIERMLDGLIRYSGRTLIILSGNDLTSQEFQDLASADKRWKAACGSARVEQQVLADANHTFATRAHREQASQATRQWLAKLI